MNPQNSKIPASAGWLGGFGAVPFIALAGATAVLDGAPRELVAHALAAYGAIILSFLGGIHWGLAIGSRGNAEDRTVGGRLIMSVVPSLAGWVAILLPERAGLLLLAISVAAMLWIDIRASRLGQAPPWYPKLRIPLTCVVVATLLVGAIA